MKINVTFFFCEVTATALLRNARCNKIETLESTALGNVPGSASGKCPWSIIVHCIYQRPAAVCPAHRLRYTTTRSPCTSDIKLHSLNGVALTTMDSYKDLGVFNASDLSFSTHYCHITPLYCSVLRRPSLL